MAYYDMGFLTQLAQQSWVSSPPKSRPSRRPRVTCAEAVASSHGSFIKVCGVTNVEDAEHAASTGANLIGMILWPKAKRSISPATAKQIAAVARRHSAQPVAVFVDEDADTIARVCEAADVQIAQLHGDGARASVSQLQLDLRVVYVMHAEKDGTLQTPVPQLDRQLDWILMDSLKGGSGESFDWQQLRPPLELCTSGWLLAGGLGPHNVAEAIQTAQPSGVDVSSGVCGPDGLRKDADKVVGFVTGAQQAFAAQRQRQVPCR